MKTEIYTNCSLVRVPIKAGVDEYYLPQNVEWAGKKIDKMIVCAPENACTDPMDGQTPVMSAGVLKDCYINLYDKNNRELMHDVSFRQFSHRNNNPLTVDAVLNLSLCRIYFTTAPEEDYTLLLYVFYDTRTEDYFDVPQKSITVTFPLLANQRITLREIINDYVHALPGRIQGVIFWNPETYPAFLTLRDKDLTYQMSDIHSEMMRSDKSEDSAQYIQKNPFWLNDLDIDFDYSYIREASGEDGVQKIIFFYQG